MSYISKANLHKRIGIKKPAHVSDIP